MFTDKFFKNVYLDAIKREKKTSIQASIELCNNLLKFEKNRMVNVKISNILERTLFDLKSLQPLLDDEELNFTL